jgi:hypothetical protein
MTSTPHVTGDDDMATTPIHPAHLWRLALWGGAAAALLLPLVAMRFTDEVRWDGSDFLAMGALLLAACGACELAMRASRDRWARLAVAIAIATAFLTVWVNLAVGMIGSEDNPDNLWFGAVLGVAIVGASMARLRAGGMAAAMLGAALVQALVASVALVDGGDARGALVSALFVAPWLLSAGLFRLATRAST